MGAQSVTCRQWMVSPAAANSTAACGWIGRSEPSVFSMAYSVRVLPVGGRSHMTRAVRFPATAGCSSGVLFLFQYSRICADFAALQASQYGSPSRLWREYPEVVP